MWQQKQFQCNQRALDYLIDFPENYEEGKAYPVIFYLHGYGFYVDPIQTLKNECPVRRERIPEGMPFILVAPKSDELSWLFQFETLCAFLENVINSGFCDRSRVYLTGSSMGGYTSWMVLMAKPQWFTAAAICCGGGQYWAAGIEKCYTLPIRAIHGRLDTTVLPRESEILAERINACGGNVELIVHEDLGHDVWTRTFTNPETYQWFLSHQKNKS